MKRAVIIVVVLVAAFFAYRKYTGSGPVKAYKAFAEEVTNRRFDAAAAMCDGITAKELEEHGTQEHIGAGPPMFQTLFKSRFDIQSEETLPDGAVRLNSIQTVLFNPVGVESAVRPAMYAKMKQTTTLKKVAGAWKVAAFVNEFQTMDSMTGR